PIALGGDGINYQPGYHIRDKDLGKIHKAACVGDVARVQQILLLRKNGRNDKDKRTRLSSASKMNVQVFCWNMVPTQILWTSVATLPSTMLSLVRICPSQQCCFHTMPALKQETRYGSTNFIFCKLHHGCGNAGSLTQCVMLGIEHSVSEKSSDL
uniref:Uncharacterized protein n=1 Tax=Catagonus wagneri TaxID=51154 RepID=A0A8C3WS77_9CETA